MEDNNSNEIVYRKFTKGGSLCIRVPYHNTLYKEGDTVDVCLSTGSPDRGQVLGEFMGENEYCRYYLKEDY